MFECVNRLRIGCKSLHVVTNGMCGELYVHAWIGLFDINSSMIKEFNYDQIGL